MHCPACGEGGLMDSWELGEDWYLEIELGPNEPIPKFVAPLVGEGFLAEMAAVRKPICGCKDCYGNDPSVAWKALSNPVRSIVEESHFGVNIRRCNCGQNFVVVFTERIDWQNGEDSQTWIALPVSPVEAEGLVDDTALISTITTLGSERRFLVRDYPTGGDLTLWWRDGDLMIGPHD
jgi:hypothetical protein